MRNFAGHGAVAIAVLIAPMIIACRMIRQTNGLNGQKRGLGLVVSRRDPHLNPMKRLTRFIFLFLAVFASLFGGAPMIFAASTTQSAHDFSFTSIDGENLPLASLKGKAVLIVNTASMCGFTSQYMVFRNYGIAIVIVGLLFLVCQAMILVGKSWIARLRSNHFAR